MTIQKSAADEEDRSLLALYPSGDLSGDELKSVEQTLRYSEEARRELAGYIDCLEVLNSAAEVSTLAEDRPSLWGRIEPELGPIRRTMRARSAEWLGQVQSISNSSLTAAALILLAANLWAAQWIASANRTSAGPAMQASSGTVAAGVVSAGTVPVNANSRLPVLVDPRDEHGLIRPILGLVVCPCEDLECGVVIDGVLEGTPAADAGLVAGDLVLAVDGRAIRGPQCLVGCLRRHGVGQQIDLDILRNGRKHSVNVMLGGYVRINGQDMIMRRSKTPADLRDVP